MMNYQKSQEGYKMNYTKESFEEVLQQAYDELEAEDIVSLLCEARDYFTTDEFNNPKINSICKTVFLKRNISFKQWKAISAYVSDCRRKENSKNNKTF